MMEPPLVLDFACYACEQTVTVTVVCECKDSPVGGRTVASVRVPCPNCGWVNKLCFEPNGTIRSVSACEGMLRLPEPSLN